MALHAMEGTEKGAEFLKNVQRGDIIVAGKNFGCGSSREHAPVAIRVIGISLVIAESFARIFHRNCVNTGLPILVIESTAGLDDGDILEVDVTTGRVENKTKDTILEAATLSELELRIMRAGGLLLYFKNTE
jgi:3-isopropylmalate dehydratase small subunit